MMAAAFGAGAVAALGQAPFGLWPLTLAGLALGYGLAVRGGGLAGWALGAGYFAVTLHWIVEPFQVDAARHGWMAPLALALLAGGLALFWAGAAAVTAAVTAPGAARPAGSGAGAGAVVVWVVALTVAEMARGHLFTGFPWGLPGHAMIDTPAAQLARVGGAYGVTFLVILLAALLGHALLHRLAWPAVAAVVGGGAVWLAATALPGVPGPRADPPTVRIVQPNVAQRDKWDPARVEAQFAAVLDATRQGAVPDLIVWPETAIPWPLDAPGAALAMAAEAGRGAPVILGANRFEGPRAFNSLAAVGPGGAILARYDKRHLVPFGEYVPLGGLARLAGLRSLAARDGYGFSPGTGPAALALPGLPPALPLICYEAVFPALSASIPRAEWIVQITNDAWFGTFAGPQQHLVQARFRAIEQGLPLVRAANTGISAVIDARGGVAARLDLGVTGILDAALPAAAPATPYARGGDAPLWALLVVLASGALWHAVRARRNRD